MISGSWDSVMVFGSLLMRSPSEFIESLAGHDARHFIGQ
jgi:hypothetical protein